MSKNDRESMHLRQSRFRYVTAFDDRPGPRVHEEARSADGISDLPCGASGLGRHDQKGRVDGRGIDRAMAGLQRISDAARRQTEKVGWHDRKQCEGVMDEEISGDCRRSDGDYFNGVRASEG